MLDSRPDVTFGDMKGWDTRSPLEIGTGTQTPEILVPSAADIHNFWSTTVTTEPKSWLGTVFSFDPFQPQQNILTTQSFDRTYEAPGGGTYDITAQYSQTGFGYADDTSREYRIETTYNSPPETYTPQAYTPQTYTPEAYTPELYTPAYTPQAYTLEVYTPQTYTPQTSGSYGSSNFNNSWGSGGGGWSGGGGGGWSGGGGGGWSGGGGWTP